MIFPGSSPLARGLQLDVWQTWVRTGIIPARAGFTLSTAQKMKSVSDHPRSRGVYSRAELDQYLKEGSSPLARGLRPALLVCVIGGGIIPARAGFTSRNRGPDRARKDHPRSRGVYSAHSRGHAGEYGSSPLARGLQAPHEDARDHAGIIPARAGFTSRRGRRRWG